jgi:hypothetical protein
MRKFTPGMVMGLIALFTLNVEKGHAQVVRQVNAIQVQSTSPFEMAIAINLGKRMWEKHRVHVDVDLAAAWKQLGVDPGYFSGCAGNCAATIYRQELDPAPGREVILKLTQSYDFCRYLIFVRASSNRAAKVEWQLLGYIDHDFNKYQMSRHRVVRAFGKNWLVIRGQEGSGSGYALFSETWYQISRKGVGPVLSYPVEGNTYPWPTGLGREFRARVFTHPFNNHIVVRYAVSYTTLDYLKNNFAKLFVNQHHAYYTWHQQANSFVFNRTRSDISEADISAIANIQTEDEQQSGTTIGGTTFYTLSENKGFVGRGYEVFLKYNSQRLMKVATGRDTARKQWLREFLEECEDITEKKALLQALQKQ